MYAMCKSSSGFTNRSSVFVRAARALALPSTPTSTLAVRTAAWLKPQPAVPHEARRATRDTVLATHEDPIAPEQRRAAEPIIANNAGVEDLETTVLGGSCAAISTSGVKWRHFH